MSWSNQSNPSTTWSNQTGSSSSWSVVTPSSSSWSERTNETLQTLYDDTNTYDVTIVGQKGYYYDQTGRTYTDSSTVTTTWTNV